jgi:hypothetical protein
MIKALSSIGSSYDRRNVIAAFVKRGEFNADDAIGLMGATEKMSDYDKAESLIAIAAKYPLDDPTVRRAFFKAAGTIASPSDYRRVMAGVLK